MFIVQMVVKIATTIPTAITARNKTPYKKERRKKKKYTFGVLRR